jgi:hypothetical protein
VSDTLATSGPRKIRRGEERRGEGALRTGHWLRDPQIGRKQGRGERGGGGVPETGVVGRPLELGVGEVLHSVDQYVGMSVSPD